jgi:hypothetical protein
VYTDWYQKPITIKGGCVCSAYYCRILVNKVFSKKKLVKTGKMIQYPEYQQDFGYYGCYADGAADNNKFDLSDRFDDKPTTTVLEHVNSFSSSCEGGTLAYSSDDVAGSSSSISSSDSSLALTSFASSASLDNSVTYEWSCSFPNNDYSWSSADAPSQDLPEHHQEDPTDWMIQDLEEILQSSLLQSPEPAPFQRNEVELLADEFIRECRQFEEFDLAQEIAAIQAASTTTAEEAASTLTTLTEFVDFEGCLVDLLQPVAESATEPPTDRSSSIQQEHQVEKRQPPTAVFAHFEDASSSSSSSIPPPPVLKPMNKLLVEEPTTSAANMMSSDVDDMSSDADNDAHSTFVAAATEFGVHVRSVINLESYDLISYSNILTDPRVLTEPLLKTCYSTLFGSSEEDASSIAASSKPRFKTADFVTTAKEKMPRIRAVKRPAKNDKIRMNITKTLDTLNRSNAGSTSAGDLADRNKYRRAVNLYVLNKLTDIIMKRESRLSPPETRAALAKCTCSFRKDADDYYQFCKLGLKEEEEEESVSVGDATTTVKTEAAAAAAADLQAKSKLTKHPFLNLTAPIYKNTIAYYPANTRSPVGGVLN